MTTPKPCTMPDVIFVKDGEDHYWARSPLKTVPYIKYIRADLVDKMEEANRD